MSLPVQLVSLFCHRRFFCIDSFTNASLKNVCACYFLGKGCAEKDTGYSGYNLLRNEGWISEPTIDACAKTCRKISNCEFWTYTRDKECIPKSKRDPQPVKGSTSGSKDCNVSK